jgi:hypothetical protein
MIQLSTTEFLGMFFCFVALAVMLIFLIVIIAKSNNKNYRRYLVAQKELEQLRSQRWQDLMNTTKQ